MAVLAVLLVVALFASASQAVQSRLRQPTPHERLQMTRVVKWIWGYESQPTPFLHVRRSEAHPVVVSVRVSRRDPRYALAAAELRTPAGHLVAWGTTLVLLNRVQPVNAIVAHDPWSYVWDGVRIPDACTASTPQAVRDLVCPNPWATLGLRSPKLDLHRKLTLHFSGDNLRRVAWKYVTVPGAVCGSPVPIRLGRRRNRVIGPGGAVIRSRLWPWWSRVEVGGGGPAAYGDVTGDGKDEAALIINCANGGGTADGQIAFAAVIYTGSVNGLRVLGIVRPRQPFLPSTPHVPLLQVTLRRGKVISHEFWYGPSDGTCCMSGRATTIWHYRHRTLALGRTVVTRRPR